MSHWNYRVMKDEHGCYGIHEVYYGKDGVTTEGYTGEPSAPLGESLEELRNDLLHMLDALDHPVMDLPAE